MSELENFDIRSKVAESVIEVFDTMLSMEIESAGEDSQDSVGVSRIVGTLNFAGNVIGIFNIQVTTEFARQMSAGLLGSEPEEVESQEEIKDLIAEISNIVGGNLKSALNDAGHPCVISTPAVTYGTDFSIKSLNMDRFERFAFCHGQNSIFVEIGLKIQEGADDVSQLNSADAGLHLKNVDLENLKNLDIKNQVSESIIEVFDTMLSMDLVETTKVSASDLKGIRKVGSVCFAGDATGLVNIQVSGDFAREMAAGLMGKAPEEIEGEEEIEDLMGEISNIVGGNLKSAFTNAGLICALSTPSYTSGTDFTIEALNMERYERFAYSHGENTVFVEMGVKINELLQFAPEAGKDIHYNVEEFVPEAEASQPEVIATEPQAAATQPVAEAPAQPAAPVQTPGIPAPTVQPQQSVPAAEAADTNPVAQNTSQAPSDFDMELLLDIPVEISVELGRTKISIHELLKLKPGEAAKLMKLEADPVDILANDTLIARGEVVIQNEKYGIRVTEITSRLDRIKSLY
jgi:flagellar motor switch protein FliN